MDPILLKGGTSAQPQEYSSFRVGLAWGSKIARSNHTLGAWQRRPRRLSEVMEVSHKDGFGMMQSFEFTPHTDIPFVFTVCGADAAPAA